MADSTNLFLLAVPATQNAEPEAFYSEFKRVRQRVVLYEYQLYAVEQTVVDRSKGIGIVAATNDPSHKVIVDILTPRAETSEERSEIWEKALQAGRAAGQRLKQTHIGYILVVSLMGFRSDLSLVLIPDGDWEKHKEALYTNINLRRLGHGGRSGLSLNDPSPSQQERLLQIYRLPSAGSDVLVFQLTILTLIKLVQAALALFGLGPLAQDETGQLIPDGLLCDSTIAGLSGWQINIAEPLMQTELGENILSAATLTALFSTIIAVRNRLTAMGIHHLPSDPFQQRTAFLTAYENYMRAFKRPQDSHYVTLPGIHFIRSQHSRTSKDSLKRAIMHRFDDIRGVATGANAGDESQRSSSKQAILMEDETIDIDSFVNAIRSRSSRDLGSVVKLWKGKISGFSLPADRKDRGGTYNTASSNNNGRSPYRRTSLPLDNQLQLINDTDRDVNPPEGIQSPLIYVTSDSEDDRGFGGKLLKGVSKNAKKLGGGVTGLLDKSANRGLHPLLHFQGAREDQPVREETLRSQQMEQFMPSREEEDYARQRAFLSPDLHMSSGRASSLSMSNNTGLLAFSGSSVADQSMIAQETVPVQAVQAPSMRRAATDLGLPTTYEEETHGGDAIKFKTQQAAFAMREKRYSFSCDRDTPSLSHILSVDRMKLDVDLSYDLYLLQQKEKELAELVEALTLVDKAYDEALACLTPTLRRRGKEITDISAKSKQLVHDVEVFTGSGSTMGGNVHPARDPSVMSLSDAAQKDEPEAMIGLAIGSERLSYAQTLLDEKLNEVEDFKKNLDLRIGGSDTLLAPYTAKSDKKANDTIAKQEPPAPGSIIVGLTTLLRSGTAGGKGTRRLLDAIGLWSTWLKYLRGRLRSYI